MHDIIYWKKTRTVNKLKNKAYEYNHREIVQPFLKLFNNYFDSAELDFFLKSLLSFIIMFITIIQLSIMICCQFSQYAFLKKLFSFFLLFHALVNILIYLVYSLTAKYKVNLKSNEIYVFDDEFNKEIKNQLKFYEFILAFFPIF